MFDFLISWALMTIATCAAFKNEFSFSDPMVYVFAVAWLVNQVYQRCQGVKRGIQLTCEYLENKDE